MGSTASTASSLNIKKEFYHFCLLIRCPNKLKLVFAPEAIVNTTQKVLDSYWSIKNIKSVQDFTEFKLNGTANVKYLICLLLNEYYALGWHFKVSSKLEYYSLHDVLIFENKEILSTYTICVSPINSNELRVFASENIIDEISSLFVFSIEKWY